MRLIWAWQKLSVFKINYLKLPIFAKSCLLCEICSTHYETKKSKKTLT